MRIEKDDVSRVVYFKAVDSADYVSPENTLTNAVVYYSVDGGAATAMTAPTITAVDTTNMAGVHKLAIDEAGMVALGANVESAELVLHIDADEMHPVVRSIEVYLLASGAEMDLVDAPNATAVTAIQAGLSVLAAGAEMDLVDAPNATAITAIQAGLSVLAAGAEMDLVDAPNATAITAIQAGLSVLAAGAEMDLVDAPNATALIALGAALVAADNAGSEVTADSGTSIGEMLAAIRSAVVGKLDISGVTLVTCEVDGSTVCLTFTLDSATTPTARSAPA